MANKEHVRILKQGGKAWNKWRDEDLEVTPDLIKAKLNGLDLHGVDLSGACLGSANLRGANLKQAILYEADLGGANLSQANLNQANLSQATLHGANLHGADLSEATFFEAELRGANLSKANLSEADLGGADLFAVNLAGANLQDADLTCCQLVSCDLKNAVLTGCKLYATARDDWVIKGVKCSCIYFDKDGKVQLPKGREFAEGEFEKLYASLPTIEYVFENGMLPIDLTIMDRVVQEIRKTTPDINLSIASVDTRGEMPSMKLTVEKEEQKEAALAKLKNEFEKKQCEMQGRLETLQGICDRLIDRPTKETHIIGNRGMIAIDGSTISIEHHACMELEKVISNEHKESKSFGKIAKDKAMDIIGGATEDVAKGLVKEAGRKIVELGIELGPVLTKTAAYLFFESMRS